MSRQRMFALHLATFNSTNSDQFTANSRPRRENIGLFCLFDVVFYCLKRVCLLSRDFAAAQRVRN